LWRFFYGAMIKDSSNYRRRSSTRRRGGREYADEAF